MPIYTIRDKNTKEEEDVIMSWKELQLLLQDNEDLEQVLQPINIADTNRLDRKDRRLSNAFKERVSKIQRGTKSKKMKTFGPAEF